MHKVFFLQKDFLYEETFAGKVRNFMKVNFCTKVRTSNIYFKITNKQENEHILKEKTKKKLNKKITNRG